MNLEDLQSNESLEHIVSSTSRALNIALGRSFQKAGIDVTTEQWSILVSLWKKDGQCQFELASCQGKDRPSITRLIDNMEKHNWVVRIPSEKDRRINLIYLTNKGKELQEQLMEIAENTLIEAISDIQDEDLEKTKDTLKKIRKNIFK